ncbi:MAG TPA: Hsp20/alpha crystallin family protein [Candidatus Omnitrophota bacterium]|nr:Hsp20/alpha crystallin family protein [Candidatus Omnitrophota bacterium]
MSNKEKILTAAVVLLGVAFALQTAYLLKKDKETTEPSAVKMQCRRPLFHKQQQPTPASAQFPGGAFSSFFDQDDQGGMGGMMDPFIEMEKIQRRMNRMFRESFRKAAGGGLGLNSMTPGNLFYEPDLDIKEDAKGYTVKMDVPGLDKDKLNVEVNENSITISGERNFEKKESDDKGFYQMERSFGSFRRAIPLPGDVKTEEVTAQYDKGVLTIRLPKIALPDEQKEKLKTVQVQ